MTKVLFLIESLGCGGAERVLVNLVNAMDKSRYDVTVNTLFNQGVNAERLNDDVHFKNLGFRQFPGITKFMYLFPSKLLYRIYIKNTDADLIIAFMHRAPAMIAAGAPMKKIVWIHSELTAQKKRFIDYLAFKNCYDKFDSIVGVSNRVCDSITINVKCRKKPVTIYNVNDVNRIKALSEEQMNQRYSGILMVTVGCLEAVKGYDRLIEVCGRLRKDYDFTLYIIGEGRDREALTRMLNQRHLENNVFLLGYQDNPYKYVKKADFFVCSSRQEGLSTAVTEAVILGRPVVSTDVSGAKEILGENNEYGLVVENSEEGIYEGIKKFLDDPSFLEHYKEKASERAAFFSTGMTVKQVEDLVDQILNGKK